MTQYMSYKSQYSLGPPSLQPRRWLLPVERVWDQPLAPVIELSSTAAPGRSRHPLNWDSPPWATERECGQRDGEPRQQLWILTGHFLRSISGLSLVGRACQASPVSCGSDDLRGPEEAADSVMGDCDADCGILRKPAGLRKRRRGLQWAGLWAPPACHSHPSPFRCGTLGCVP